MKKKSTKKVVVSPFASRINRISGQVEAIKKMINKSEDCSKILLQLKAARSAMKALESIILESHLNSCLGLLTSKDQTKKNKKIAELKEIFSKFE